MRGLHASALLVLTSICAAQQTMPCASCHPAESAAYNGTRMASALRPAIESAFAENVEGLSLHESGDGYRFVYTRQNGALKVTAFREADSIAALIDWVFGSGAQGQTPVLRSGDRYFESRVSYFPGLHQYGITVGQTAAASKSAAQSLGREKTASQLAECFVCHSVVKDANFARVLPGVQCEQCHPGAAAHAAGRAVPLNPGKLSARQQVMLCGNCHRVLPPVGEGELENVRFQPLRLMKSACFGSGKLMCTTCHPAHQDAKRQDPEFYNSRCVACHGPSVAHSAQQRSADCIGCHMPQVQLHPALRFTDHFIRVAHLSEYPAGTVVQRSAETQDSSRLR